MQPLLSYFPDLSSYTRAGTKKVPTLNVGWLDSSHLFETSAPSTEFLARLWEFCLVMVRPMRGAQHCPLCQQLGVAELHGDRLMLGSGEIRVFERQARWAYASPNLVYHYVKVHKYLPPQEFVDAVSSGPSPLSDEYFELLWRSGSPWVENDLNPGVFRLVRRDGELVRELLIEPGPSKPGRKR